MSFLRYAEIIVGTASQSILIKDLRILLDIQKSRISYPNKAKISIYNLNVHTRNQIKYEFTKILVNAGYVGNVQMIFTGNIKNVYHRIDSVDTITEIYAGDGDSAWVESIANVSVSSQQSLKDIVTLLVGTMDGVTIGKLNGLDQGLISNQTITYSGSTRDQLNKLSDTYSFDWAITNNIFETVAKNQAIESQTNATVISAETGMVGSPTVTEIGADVNCLLNPALLPNRWIVIKASGSDVSLGDPYFRPANKNTVAQGYYVINELEHVFDNRGGDALTKIKARQMQ